MKFLGIDYGMKRIGFAVSDAGGRLAFPGEVVKNNGELVKKIGELISKEKVGEIVVGESLDFAGLPNALAKEVDFFIGTLERKFKLPVHKEKEFFSSFEAHDKMGKEAMHARRSKAPKTENLDARAAAVILQRFLDRHNKQS